jgi:transcriptional regulator with XRE-family HTH domain
MRIIGHAIADLRAKKGLTQEGLAEALNYSEKHLQQIEAGRRNCSIGALLDIAFALERPLGELLEGLARGAPVSKSAYPTRESVTASQLALAEEQLPRRRTGRPPRSKR